MAYEEPKDPLTGKGRRHVVASTLGAMGIGRATISEEVQDKMVTIEPPVIQLDEFVDLLEKTVNEKIKARGRFPKNQQTAVKNYFMLIRRRIQAKDIENRRAVFDFYDTYYSSSKFSITGRFIMIDAFMDVLGEETYKRWRDENYEKLKNEFTGSFRSILGR